MKYDLTLLRKKLNLRQKDLASMLNIKQSFLSAIENGKSRLPEEKEAMLLSLFDNSVLEEVIVETHSNRGVSQVAQPDMQDTMGTAMIKELLNYFHTQAHRDQDAHHEQMHLQIDEFQERNNQLMKKNDELHDKIDRLSEKIEALNRELYSTRDENLRLKKLLIDNNIPY